MKEQLPHLPLHEAGPESSQQPELDLLDTTSLASLRAEALKFTSRMKQARNMGTYNRVKAISPPERPSIGDSSLRDYVTEVAGLDEMEPLAMFVYEVQSILSESRRRSDDRLSTHKTSSAATVTVTLETSLQWWWLGWMSARVVKDNPKSSESEV